VARFKLVNHVHVSNSGSILFPLYNVCVFSPVIKSVVLSACDVIYASPIEYVILYIRKSSGPRVDPCGTPQVICLRLDLELRVLISMNCCMKLLHM
jgi:hypothetical protein